MTVLNDLLNVLLPNHSTHVLFEFAHRLQRQHLVGLAVALGTVGLYAQVGQAGIGGVNQVQVSNLDISRSG